MLGSVRMMRSDRRFAGALKGRTTLGRSDEPDAGTGPDLLLALASSGPGTLRRRLRNSLHDAIRSGRLPPGSRLPSSRVLAADLGVSRGVVIEAYAQLSAEGFLISRSGSGTVVADTGGRPIGRIRSGPEPKATPQPSVIEIDLRPGPPDLATFPRSTWAKATREVLRSVADADLGYVAPWGVEALRGQLSEYLARVRGVTTEPACVVVVSGATQGITLLTRVLRASGLVNIGVEAPSNPVQRQVLARYGVRVWDIPVDKDGMVVDELARSPCRAVIATPGHQYPCGMVMSPSRRTALARWAETIGGIVIEDDYDAVFRHDNRQVGALQMLSAAHVALVGSVSKSLAPGLRLGWVVSPPALVEELRMAKRDDDFGTSVLEQHTLARLIAAGDYDRHVRRLRGHYRKRRDVAVHALQHELRDAVIEGYAAGLHLLVRLPPDIAEESYVAAAADLGVAVLGTSPMYGKQPAQQGFLVGYGRTSPAMLEEAASRLGAAMAAVRQSHSISASREGRQVTRRRGSTGVDYF